MSLCRNRNSGTRMCAMFLSDPVSRLSTQMTRWPRRRSSSHRCDPRNPAPPVTRQVAMNAQGTACGGATGVRRHRGGAGRHHGYPGPGVIRAPRSMAIAAVAALAAVVRLPLLFDRYDDAFAPDSALYLSLADGLRSGLHFPTDYRGPGYPAFVALAHVLPGRVEDMAILLQHALGAGMAAAIVAVGWRWFGPVAGVAAGVVAAVSPVVLNVEHDVLPDTVFCAVVLAATIALATAATRRPVSYRLLVAAGVLFGLAAYVKPNAQAFALVAIVPLAVATRSLRATLAGSAVVAGALVLTIVPWVVRNGVRYDHYSMSAQGGDALFLRAFDQ